MAMTLMERDNFRQKMLDEYGPGWESIVKDYGGMVNPQVGPQHGALVPGAMTFDPTRFRTDNPLSLLSSREDIELALREPTKQDYINELDRMDPDRLQGPVRPPMEMNTSGVPYWDDPETAGTKIPFPYTGNNELRDQINTLYKQGQSNYYGPSGFQNEISPLPYQLEGPETSPGDGSVPARFYDPNQELYDPNYYGTAGQMGMGSSLSPGKGMGTMSDGGMHPFSQAVYGDKMPGLLDSGEGQFSQAFPGSDSDDGIVGSDQFPEWARQPVGPLAETGGEGGKWESDPRFRNALAKYIMQLGNNYSQTDPFYLD